MRKEILKELTTSFSPSGAENFGENLYKSVDVFKNYMDNTPGLRNVTYPPMAGNIGNILYSIGYGPKTVLLSAHIDSVVCKVSYINDDGKINIMHAGGTDRAALVASRVVILGDNGPVFGIIGKKPIHLEGDEKKYKYNEYDGLTIDVGAETWQGVKDLGVHVGCDVVYERYCNTNFGENRVCATDLDDKAGVFVVMELAKKLNDLMAAGEENLWKEYTFYFAATTGEEIGLRGATVLAHDLNPHISIDFDVTFAEDSTRGVKASDAKVCGVKLGKGACIAYGGDKSRRIAKLLEDIAEENDIMRQQLATRPSGTNTSVFQTQAQACETMLISIPNQSMHTPVEVCDWRDIESAIELTYKLLISSKL